MEKLRINLACGDCYVDGWLNLDYVSRSPSVKSTNLLGHLPADNNSASVVYSSHFLEHIPTDLVPSFLSECYRVLRNNGILRLALPDWEELCETYLILRKSGAHDKADFLLLEMLDQCVRMKPGGRLGDYYIALQRAPEQSREMIKFVFERTGHIIQPSSQIKKSRFKQIASNPRKLIDVFREIYIKSVILLLPSAFKKQNVSRTTVGEKHMWMYDFYSVKQLLESCGFINVKKMNSSTSGIEDFPFYPLDLTKDGMPRKGKETMYIEAEKP